jgi:hypothetical protein
MMKGWKGERTTASYLVRFPIDAKLAGVGLASLLKLRSST